ncbi:unnamed protein product [Rotaria sp. Silwood2]|nr:unnamed protein product [Rotaria sp. Silwood2]CAF4570840.1 unnamed protein product [Rotaria sp. Silwood2]
MKFFNYLINSIKIGINGFDLLGQHIFRCALEKGIQVVAINDKSIPLDYMIYMSKYNSTHGKFKGTISNYFNGTLIANGQVINVFMEKEASKIPWNQFDAEYVIETTDESTTIDKCQQHLQAGVKKVIITRSSSDVPMFVMGVNQDKYTGKERILSSASSTTNSLAPLVKVVHEKFGIIEGLMTIIHSYTPIQNIIDGPSDKGLRCGRGAAQNIIPLKTDVAKDIGKIIPDLNEKLTGIVLHVPTPSVSVIDLSIRLNTHAKYEEIRNTIKEAASGPLRNILAYTKDKVVSTDFIGDTHSSIFNAKPGISLNDNFVKLIAWYDNEYGYAHCIVDLIKYIARKDREYQA